MTNTTDTPYINDAVIRLTIQNFMDNVHTVHPCKVTAIRADGSVDVNLMIYRVLSNNDSLAIPTLTQLPVLFSGNDTFNISFSVGVGDEGLAIFNERDISKFIELDEGDQPPSLRSFSLSDAVYLPTPISKAKRLTPRADALLLSNNGTEIEITDGLIRINGDLEINGKTTTNGDIEASGNIEAVGEVTAMTNSTISKRELSTHEHCYVSPVGGAPTTPIPPTGICP